MGIIQLFICDNPDCPKGGVSQELGNHFWCFKYLDCYSGPEYHFCSLDCMINKFTNHPPLPPDYGLPPDPEPAPPIPMPPTPTPPTPPNPNV